MNVIDRSRAATVKVASASSGNTGTGFLIADQYVLTCLHVAAAISQQGSNINVSVYPDLKVTLASGETIGAAVVTMPTPANLEPLQHDFAVLKLQSRPNKPVPSLALSAASEPPNVGDGVIFSGFPLATPGMVTHRGMVSGHDDSNTLIFIEAAVNKGNSGGALLDEQGRVIGIVSMREGGISQGLQQVRGSIEAASKTGGSVLLMGVNPLDATKMVIDTLDAYISTGIGYAWSIKFAREYIANNNTLTK